MKQILAGEGFYTVFKEFPHLSGECLYRGKAYEVWSVTDYTLKELDKLRWKASYGWWRYAEGCNIADYPVREFLIHGKSMLGYYDPHSDDNSSEYYSLLDYLCCQIGASTESNVCAVSTDLAKINNMSLAMLFAKYQCD